ncbi:envelope stress response membrane protein PspC [Aliagarivorans taiwanensis]|uniref:envelope stress response membrane protein PspC n=1 Tax=Aliagarivorans taiwanensis TaxID=561966 RepID=UPI00040EE146|nr:envelope stress response membrane protein PspC [Aliagarivorans taiwanensis]
MSKLFRDTANGKLAGVCAGIARRFEIETWVVRILVVTLGLFNPWMMLILYGAAALFLDKLPNSYQEPAPQVKSRAWQKGEDPHSVLGQLESEFSNIENRLQQLEKVVTRRDFETHRQFRDL